MKINMKRRMKFTRKTETDMKTNMKRRKKVTRKREN